MDFKVFYLGPLKFLHNKKERQQRKEGGRGRKRCVKERW